MDNHPNQTDPVVSQENNAFTKELCEATNSNNLDKVKDMLQDPDVDPNGFHENYTSLHTAAANDHVDIALELLKHQNIDPNKGDTWNCSPLWVACT